MRNVALLLFVSTVCVVGSDAALSCENYNPVLCFPDLRKVCLVNGTMMVGTCQAQTAICGERAKEATDMGCCTGIAACVALNSGSLAKPAMLWTAVIILLHLLRHF